MLSTDFIAPYKDLTPPWGPMGYVIYKRTYARRLPCGRVEEWYETCERVCNGLSELGAKMSEEELEYLFDTMFHLRGTVSGRALWQLGTDTVRKVGADSLQNCWHVVVNKFEAFTFTFNQLMLGGGVGFNILPEHVYELPKISHNPTVKRVDDHDCTFIVPDNREGWVRLLQKVFEAFTENGKDVRFDTSCVRAKGRPIKGFGGTASGPEDLVKGIEQIVTILRKRVGTKLRPVDCMDIMNIIGQVVVAGNVRRSSEIALGDCKDVDYLDAKNWGRHPIPNWRTMSNNSVIAEKFEDLPPAFWESGYVPMDGKDEVGGEPYGLVNLKNCREFGRLCEGRQVGRDALVEGVNPCAEITLGDKEGCNLAEVFLPNIRTLEEFKKVTEVLYKACKTISCAGFSDPDTQAIVDKHHRIGIGLTGYMQAHQWHDAEALDEVYRNIVATDVEYSKLMGVKTSIKFTTMKPSGTLSLLPGVLPGMHGGLGRYMLRTVRFMADHPLVAILRENGYRVEPKLELDGSQDHGTMVIYFPIKQEGTLATEIDVIQELEIQKHLQTYWSDNAVSATHYFEPGDIPKIQEWLKENYEDGVKSTSFLRREGHGFKQAPFQPISKEEYEVEAAKVTPIVKAEIVFDGEDLDSDLECSGGSCPVR